MTERWPYPDPVDVAALRALTVLYVEDDAEVREVTTPFLERRVGRVITAANGREGLERFGAGGIELVVSDVLMPELDGLDMADAIRARAPHVPIVLVTAFERPEFMRRAIDIGVTRYVLKPVDPGRLDEALMHCARLLAAERAHELARQRERDLVLARHAAAIGQLAAGLAHDYNNLMQAVVGSIDLLEYTIRHGLDASRILEIAHRGFDQATRLSKQLEALHHADASERVVAPVDVAIRAAVTEALAGSPVRLEWRVPPDLPAVQHHPARLGEVATALTVNAMEAMEAMDAMKGPGVLTIDGRIDQLGELNDRHLPSGPYVHILFTDTGKGIAPELLETLFDPYVTTKTRSARKGVGLGLAIARAVIAVHRGALTVESWPGETTFHVYLPVAAS